MSGWRNIEVGSVMYKWRPGKTAAVVRDPDGKGHVIDLSKLLGVSHDEIKRARSKGSAYPVTPGLIADWIRANLID